MSEDRHPLNQSFAWRSTSRPLRRLEEAQARAFDEQGYLALDGAIAREEVAELAREIDPYESEVSAFLETRPDGRLFIADARAITFTTHLVTRSERLRRFCASLLFQDLCADLIGPDARLYWDQAVYKKPGTEKSFPWHQDNAYTFIEPQQYLTCWVALTDTDERNGCPRVLPGWHRRGTLAHRMTDAGWSCAENPGESVALPLGAGGIAVFSSLTPHCTGPNESEAARKAYIVQFAPDGAMSVSFDTKGARVETAQSDPGRQFEVLRGGKAVD